MRFPIRRKGLIFAAIVLVAAMLPIAAQGTIAPEAPQAPHPPMHPRMEAPHADGFHDVLMRGLMGRMHAAKPTEAQREEIHQLMQAAHEGVMGQRMKAVQESRRDLGGAIFDVNLSETELRAALQQAAEVNESFALEAAVVTKSIYNLLDADQQAAWDAFEPRGMHARGMTPKAHKHGPHARH
jgi:Spy/CpxP family protein refolding chaperone